MDKLKKFINNILFVVRHLFKRVMQSPLLLGWIIIGTIIDIITWGYQGLKVTIINLVLLALFTIIIKMMTDNKEIKYEPKFKHLKLELFTGILFYVFLFIVIATFWGQVKVQFINAGFNELTGGIKKLVVIMQGLGLPAWSLGGLYNASLNIVLELAPIIILFLIWRYSFREMGFVFNNIPLIAVLLIITVILGLPSKIILQQPFYKTIILYFIQIFINGLPEELIFRGYLLPRFEAVLKNQINALIVVSLLFNMLHIPSNLVQGFNVYKALMISFGMLQPTGLIWGYLYLKTRSIVPGVIWHTSFGVLGLIFISSI